MHLLTPSMQHIRELMTWFPDEPSLRVWGGPLFRFPFTEDSFLHDVHWGRMATYVLGQTDGVMLGFGQLYLKEGRAHLARLAVAPAQRGAGIGRLLVGELIKKGQELFPGADNSLYVMRANERVLRCYLQAGFEKVPILPGEKAYPDQMFMVRKQSVTPNAQSGSPR